MDHGRSRYQGFRGTMSRVSTGLAGGAALLVLAGAVPMAVDAPQLAAVAASLVFDGVTVIDVEHGKLLPAQRVVIVGNRITAMGGALSVPMPKDAQVVDARGKYLIPGLWDMHAHPYETSDPPDPSGDPLLIANGITGIRNAGAESINVPLHAQIRIRREILAGTRVGPPRQLLSGSYLGEVGPCTRRTYGYEFCVADPADARHLVDSLKAAGADMIKPRDVGRAIYFAVAAEARRLHIPFGGHGQYVTAFEASDSGANIIDHAQETVGADGMVARCWGRETSTSVERCQPVAERFRLHNTWWVPTIVVFRTGDSPRRYGPVDGTRHSDPFVHRFEKVIKELRAGKPPHGNWLRDSTRPAPRDGADSLGYLRAAQRVGLPIMAGTDWGRGRGAGFSLHTEMAIYATEGLTRLSALQSATLNPAKMLGATDSLGTVAPGKLADLVLLDANPLDDITNTTMIRAVVANGRYFDRAALDKLLVEGAARARDD